MLSALVLSHANNFLANHSFGKSHQDIALCLICVRLELAEAANRVFLSLPKLNRACQAQFHHNCLTGMARRELKSQAKFLLALRDGREKISDHIERLELRLRKQFLKPAGRPGCNHS